MTTQPQPSYHGELRTASRAGRAVTWIAGRRWGLQMMQRLTMKPMVGNKIDGIINDEIFIPSTTSPGHKIRARVYKPADADTRFGAA